MCVCVCVCILSSCLSTMVSKLISFRPFALKAGSTITECITIASQWQLI